MIKRIFTSIFIASLVSGIVINPAGNMAFAIAISASATTPAPAPAKVADKCGFIMPDKKEFKGEITQIENQKVSVARGKVFKVKFYLKNTGNVPWTRLPNACNWPIITFHTASPKDRQNPLYFEGIKYNLDNLSANMVKMNKNKTLPGETATFSMFLKGSEKDDAFKLFYTPEIKDGDKIIDMTDNKVTVEVTVGKPEKDPEILKKRFYLTGETSSVMDFDPNGEKLIKIDLSDQKLMAIIDKKIVRTFPVSTGAPRTPTPTGDFKVLTKHEIRVAWQPPYYTMPNFMMIREGGLGIHALPSLGKTGDAFWTEAKEHIGKPISHGCIRLLPEDSNFLYKFGDIGVKVKIEK